MSYKTKNGDVKSQLHLYITPELYNELKETVLKYNNNTYDKTTISELIRFLITEFIKNYNTGVHYKVEFLENLQEFRETTKGGVKQWI